MFLSGEKTERRAFHMGCFLLAAEGLSLAVLWVLKPVLSAKIVAVILAGLACGRTASILTGLELAFSTASITLLLFAFNTAWLLLFFPLIIISYRRAERFKLFASMARSTKRLAEVQKERIVKTDWWFLPVFIWLPFPWTGALVGSVIGFLMGLPTARILLIAISSMLIGIVTWIYGFEYLLVFTGTEGKVVSALMVIGLVLLHVYRIRKLQN